jgi:hypothetical protein
MNASLMNLLGLLCLVGGVVCGAISWSSGAQGLRLAALALMVAGLVLRLLARRAR